MPQVKYVGGFDEVEVLGRVVKRGESAEFTADEAKSLLEQQDNYQPAKKGDAQ